MPNTRRIYEDLKRLWLATADHEQRDEAEAEFDGFVQGLLKQGAQVGAAREAAGKPDLEQPEKEEVSQSRMLMEIILEVDTAIQMVPPRLKQYRDLLASHGLDKSSDVSGEDGQKGLAGINLADQAALEFHRALLGLSINIAQAEVFERMNKKPTDQ